MSPIPIHVLKIKKVVFLTNWMLLTVSVFYALKVH